MTYGRATKQGKTVGFRSINHSSPDVWYIPRMESLAQRFMWLGLHFALTLVFVGCEKKKDSITAKEVQAKTLAKLNSIKRYEAQFEHLNYIVETTREGIRSDLDNPKGKFSVDSQVVLPDRIMLTIAMNMQPRMPPSNKMFVVSDGEWVFSEMTVG
jgi:hypothetical protein